MHVQSCCFAYKTFFFYVLVAVRVVTNLKKRELAF